MHYPQRVYSVNRRVQDLYSSVIPNHVTLSLPKGRFGKGGVSGSHFICHPELVYYVNRRLRDLIPYSR